MLGEDMKCKEMVIFMPCCIRRMFTAFLSVKNTYKNAEATIR
ncbi:MULTISPECIES: hypothetical protein [Aneurinibacillus]|nr:MULTISPECIES: hypothetical protein [Aneurinibacillus]MED0676806.1 hypothetical protein [Aneurinibacillus thermoaerophilus]MED0738891.1 hypothetical protein [Aneurinibacillus thermoaerophilus]MED0757873.1 hypothetical protein [Aneurinibacillus thermoaerophilus]MED0762148.1 hypothetical protein [Aneurinibacillus thermoaerophilus]